MDETRVMAAVSPAVPLIYRDEGDQPMKEFVLPQCGVARAVSAFSRSASLFLVGAVLGALAHGCGSGAGPDAAPGFSLNRATFLRLLALEGATSESAPENIDQVLRDVTESAASNGLDERVVRFAELAGAVIQFSAARGADSSSSPEVPLGALPDKWEAYWRYFQLARALARIYAPELADQFDGPLASLEEVAGEIGSVPTEVDPFFDPS